MNKKKTVFHVIDGKSRQRAEIARHFFGFGHHVEIYDSLTEFSSSRPEEGIVLAHDDGKLGPSKHLVEMVRQMCPRMNVVLYAVDPSHDAIVEGMFAGAIDYMVCPMTTEATERMYERAIGKGSEVNRIITRKVEASEQLECLSGRERQVLRFITNGYSNKAVALDLGISPRTVEIHRSNVMKKLGVGSTADAVRIGVCAGLDLEEAVEMAPLAGKPRMASPIITVTH